MVSSIVSYFCYMDLHGTSFGHLYQYVSVFVGLDLQFPRPQQSVIVIPLQYSVLSLAIIRSKKRAADLFKRQWCPVKVAKTAMVSFENAIFSEHVGKIHHFNQA